VRFGERSLSLTEAEQIEKWLAELGAEQNIVSSEN
jgi:hypothetical protein